MRCNRSGGGRHHPGRAGTGVRSRDQACIGWFGSGCGTTTTLRSSPTAGRVGRSAPTPLACPVVATAVFFHAHPDDEAIQTGGTMAKLADGGPRVGLVTAPRGEL